jgi:hypothetical protein
VRSSPYRRTPRPQGKRCIETKTRARRCNNDNMASLPIKFTELVSLTSCGIQVSEIEAHKRYQWRATMTL